MQPDDDAYWRRPVTGTGSSDGEAADHKTASDHGTARGSTDGPPPVINLHYQGPPPSNPPPAGWRPARVVQPAPPRRLPEQNHAAMDDQEARARTLSLGLAIVAGSVLVIILCAICGRTLF